MPLELSSRSLVRRLRKLFWRLNRRQAAVLFTWLTERHDEAFVDRVFVAAGPLKHWSYHYEELYDAAPMRLSDRHHRWIRAALASVGLAVADGSSAAEL